MYTIFIDNDLKSETKGLYSVRVGSVSYDGFKTYKAALKFAENNFNNPNAL